MNENIDLTKILENCPTGTKLYTPVWGEVTFNEVEDKDYVYPICIYTNTCTKVQLTKNGCLVSSTDSECILFPSKDQRDWSKFTAPWYKKEKFDPKTLQPFDKVLVRSFTTRKWRCKHFSCFMDGEAYPYMCFATYRFCVPYNEDTKHLVGTTDEAPEYYRYWDD